MNFIDTNNKFNIHETCPSEFLYEYENIEYPSPIKVTYYSKTTNSNRPLNIILPKNYNKNKKYPVLYLLHGLFGDEDSLIDEDLGLINIVTNLIDDELIKEIIIVFPNEYAPEEGKRVMATVCKEYFDGYDNFIYDLINDIMPYMESNYAVAVGRENTAIAGFSMGGRNSLYIGYKRPDLFGYVGAFSPAPGVVPGKDYNGVHEGLFSKDEFRANTPLIVSLICCGTKDTVVGNFPRSYHQILTKNNQKHIWFEIPEADHDYKAITSGFYNFLTIAFSKLD
jgi:enterochelin esterase-like enzyme